jgi:hypothetical protein
MRATIRDAHILYEIQPLNLFSYLRGRHWYEIRRLERGAFWGKTIKDSNFEILLPLDSSIRDYPNRVSDVLKTLEQVEGRSQFEIVEDLLVSSADVIRQRLATPKGEGLITLEQGMLVYEKARDLMLAAACAAIAPKPVYAKRKPEQAMEYLNHACFGIPKQGSYTLTIISPVSPKLRANNELFEEELEPFERRTVRTLSEALVALASATREATATAELEPIRAAVNRGVSANLCEAILGLHHSGGGRGLEFSFTWAASRGAPNTAPEAVSLAPEVMPILEEASRFFRQTGTIESTEVVGLVQKLEHRGHIGRVTVFGNVDGATKSVVMDLTEEEHELAIRAYEQRLKVTCVGELKRSGNSWILQNPRAFSIIEEAA